MSTFYIFLVQLFMYDSYIMENKTYKIGPSLAGTIIANAAVQATLGNLELPSRVLERKFTTTKEDIDAFINSVHGYMFIGSLWAIGTTLVIFEKHRYYGAIMNLLLQIAAMTWIITRRYITIKHEADKYNLKMGSIFSFS